MMRPSLKGPRSFSAHDHVLAVAQVCDLYIRWQRQGLVSPGHRVHVVTLAIGGAGGVEARGPYQEATPRSRPAFGAVEHEIALAEHIVERADCREPTWARREARDQECFRCPPGCGEGGGNERMLRAAGSRKAPNSRRRSRPLAREAIRR